MQIGYNFSLPGARELVVCCGEGCRMTTRAGPQDTIMQRRGFSLAAEKDIIDNVRFGIL